VRLARPAVWVLVAAWLVVIWTFGESQALQVTGADPGVRWLVRKGVHLVVYGVLGGLLALALGARDGWRWVLGLCLAVALADEIHQRFVPNRTFTVRDLGLDLTGGFLGAAVIELVTPTIRSGASDAT